MRVYFGTEKTGRLLKGTRVTPRPFQIRNLQSTQTPKELPAGILVAKSKQSETAEYKTD